MNLTKLLQAPLPIDGAAHRVVFGKSEHWAPRCRQTERFHESDVQPQTRPITNSMRNSPNFADLRRLRYGAFTVIGLSAELGKAARWVCRCDCGVYATMTAKHIRRGVAGEFAWAASCTRCQMKRRIRGEDDMSAMKHKSRAAP